MLFAKDVMNMRTYKCNILIGQTLNHINIDISFNFIFYSGRIVSPAKGTKFTFLPGSTGNLTWIFDDEISTLDTRCWYFIPSGGSSEQLARIFDDDNPEIRQSSLPRVEIVKPGTLLLKNVNQNYNGIYTFSLNGRYLVYPVSVKVLIASKYHNL